jgi:Fe-S oxidoreductase
VFTEDDRLNAVRSCRYCPMCHHADLATRLERRETYSARGRGLVLFAVDQGKLHLDAEVADVMYRFFADGLCQHVCAGHIPHDEMVIDARRRLVAADHAPEAVTRVKANIEVTGNPWGEEEPDLFALTGAKFQEHVLVYFGSAARVRRPAVVKALAALLRKASVRFSVLDQEGDLGLLLHQLGHAEAGAAAAKALARKIAISGARTVVTPDAEAYQTLKIGFGEVPPLLGLEVRHTAELIAELVGGFKFRTPARLQVAYHDPCVLARLAPCLDAPRALLRTVCDAAPLEIGIWSRKLANCSGECGGVPFTRPALSQKAAERRICEAREAGAELIVAGSPAAAATLEGRGLEVRELSEFVAESLAQ